MEETKPNPAMLTTEPPTMHNDIQPKFASAPPRAPPTEEPPISAPEGASTSLIAARTPPANVPIPAPVTGPPAPAAGNPLQIASVSAHVGLHSNENAMITLTAAAAAAKPATPIMSSQPAVSVRPSASSTPLPPPALPPAQTVSVMPIQPMVSGMASVAPPPTGMASPIGKVVESGHEHTGRWTKEEHEAFLAALQLYGKEWKKVAARVKTRTVVQTRTHAQKYFQKLQKVLEGGEGDLSALVGVGGVISGSGMNIALGTAQSGVSGANLAAMVDLGLTQAEGKKTSGGKKKGSHTKQQTSVSIPQQVVHTRAAQSSPSMIRSSSTTAAAHLMANMSTDRRSISLSAPVSTRPSICHQGSSYSSTSHTPNSSQHGFTTADSSISAHGFGYPKTHSISTTVAIGSNTNTPTSSLPGISIVAPSHDDMIKLGKFPEPSPAACGKRKMAEIAAAQMLAGVVGATAGSSPNPSLTPPSKRSNMELRCASAAATGSASATIAAMTVAVETNNNPSAITRPPQMSSSDQFSASGICSEDGRATPPSQIMDSNTLNAPTSSNYMKQSPSANSPPAERQTGGRGLSLQIVNPDSLCVATNEGTDGAKRRLINGQASPSTPWDGQLEALVSHVKSQEAALQGTYNLADVNGAAILDGEHSSSNSQSKKASDSTISINQAKEPRAAATAANVILPPPLQSPRSALQSAICNGAVNEVSQICATFTAASSSAVLNERDDAGFYPLHSAASLGLLDRFGPNCEEASAICRLLVDSGADVTCRDRGGNTPVHWAARAGHSGALGLLLLKICPIDAQNDAGETALHWAMRAGSNGFNAVQVLVENGARVNIFNRNFKRPLDVAAGGFNDPEESRDPVELQKGGENSNSNVVTTTGARQFPVNACERRSTRWKLLKHSSQCRTLVLHHHECLDHVAKSAHDWEVPDRIHSIISTLSSRTSDSTGPDDDHNFKPCEVTVSNEFERATLELLSRIHSAEYLAFVNDLSKELERRRKQQLIEENQSDSSNNGGEKAKAGLSLAVIPFTPMVQRNMMKEAVTKKEAHSDTSFSAGSLKAARRAAGAVQHAVDCVLVGRNRNAFCVVRPPGHHAGINGLLFNAESCGFCLFNNVAAGAMHALSDEKHRPRCERCAIVDIDAHHGNGTEEIVRKCHDSGRLLFFSVHLYDYDKPRKGNDFQYKFYPGTGAEDDVAHNVINVPIAPLWREKEVVKSISLASNGSSNTMESRQHNTRQKSKQAAAAAALSSSELNKVGGNSSTQVTTLKQGGSYSVKSDNVALDVDNPPKPRSNLPSSSPHYPPHYLMGVGRLAYRRAIQHRLLPALRAFNPDLIIMSTGFDAARGDVGNARHYMGGAEAMGFDLEPEDYAWTVRKVCEVADMCCHGRVVSVLEGGYGRTPPPLPVPPFLDSKSTQSSETARCTLDRSFFSECAMQHLKGLIDPYGTENESLNHPNRKRH